MSLDLVLKPCCDRCDSTSDLYGSDCKHMTLCLECGKDMAANRGRCRQCGTLITKLIQEYNVQGIANTDEDFYIGRFHSGLPPFSKNSAENRWSLDQEGLQEGQLTDILWNENKPWILEDETGQHQFQGQVEGPQSSTAPRYLLMVPGRDCFIVPDGNRYSFRKIAQYKQLTLEEAEEIMNKRRHNATGHGRWMMKTATSGAASFLEVKKNEGISKAEADEGISKAKADEGSQEKEWKRNDEGDHSDKGDEDKEEWETRKNRFACNKFGVDDDKEGGKGGDFNLDDDDIEKGDDWEHEKTFTDDDDPREREELDPIPAPPEIKPGEDEEDEDEENGTLSKSGKEIKKLLVKAAGLNEFKGEEEEEDEDTIVKAEAVMNSYEPSVSTKPPSTTATPGSTSPSTAAVTEEEIRAAIVAGAPVKARDLVEKLKPRVKTSEERRPC